MLTICDLAHDTIVKLKINNTFFTSCIFVLFKVIICDSDHKRNNWFIKDPMNRRASIKPKRLLL